jgi:predicted DCC family thiol-disulfide oxidoreductase YuxK
VPDWGHPERVDFLSHSDAVVAALMVCGGTPRGLGRTLKLAPPALRDAGYSFVGHLRYRLFGPWRDRPLPNPAWKSRIIL